MSQFVGETIGSFFGVTVRTFPFGDTLTTRPSESFFFMVFPCLKQVPGESSLKRDFTQAPEPAPWSPEASREPGPAS